MPRTAADETALKALVEKMVAAKQLSPTDARMLTEAQTAGKGAPVRSEDDVLRWLAKEYGVDFTSLDDVQPDRELL